MLFSISTFRLRKLFALLAVSLSFLTAQAEVELEVSGIFGSSNFDRFQGVTVDSQGFLILCGESEANNYPLVKPYDTYNSAGQSGNNRKDGVVTKLTPDGKSVIFSTYIGGRGREGLYTCITDANDDIILVGTTGSDNFPTTPGVYDSTHDGGQYSDCFVAKLSKDGGTLIFSTFVDGSGKELCRGNMAIKPNGNIVVSGQTDGNFPTTPGAYDRQFDGPYDAMIFELSSDGKHLTYSTYLGGSGSEHALGGVIILPDGTVVTAGGTSSNNFPTTPGAVQTSYQGGAGTTAFDGDAYVARFSSDLSRLLSSTYLGGAGNDSVAHNSGLRMDKQGNPVVYGNTTSNNFPTSQNAYDKSWNGSGDVFVTKLSKNLKAPLLGSTYVGGSSRDYASGITVLDSGVIVVSGQIDRATDFPTTVDAYSQLYIGGSKDIHIIALSPDTSTLVYSSYFGGTASSTHGERGRSVWQAGPNSFLIGGATDSSDFPFSPGTYQTRYGGGGSDAFFAKFKLVVPAPPSNLRVQP